MMNIASPDLLTKEIRQEIDAWLKKFPADQRRSAVIPALKLAQEKNNGWLDEAHMNAVADYLQLPRIAVYEVASFYTLFHLKPVGKNRLYVCTNISCLLRDSDEIASHVKKKLNIGFGETTPDGQFSLFEVECLGACGGAPAMQVGTTYHENLTPEKIDNLLTSLAGKAGDTHAK